MPTSANVTYSADRLDPLYDADQAHMLPVNLAPLGSYARGLVLGQVTAAVNEVQSLAITATGGTYTLTYTDPITGVTKTTAALNYNDNAATIAAALNAAGILGTSGAGVTGTGPYVITLSGTLYAGKAQNLLTVGTGSLTGGSATITRTTSGQAAGTWKAYASGNSDGSQTPKRILQYACTTDALGRVLLGESGATPWGDTRPDAPAYYSGTFDCSRLAGLDATALANANWRLIDGSVSTGVVRLG